jgi:hypothetical protein
MIEETIPLIKESVPLIIAFHSKWSIALFTSSITIASFLFTMKAFIIQTVKSQVYDSPEHMEKVRLRRASGAPTKYYGGLENLACLLKWTIIAALFNAISQLLLSGFDSELLSMICLILSGLTAILFSFVVWTVSKNISDMILIAEKKAQSSID